VGSTSRLSRLASMYRSRGARGGGGVWLCVWLCGCVAVHTNRVPAVSGLVPHNSHAQQSLAWLAMMVMRPRCTRFVLCFTTFLAVPLTLAVG